MPIYRSFFGVASILQNYILIPDNGAFAFTGTSANLEYHQIGISTGGSYAFTGTVANLEIGYEVAASAGTFTVTGVAVALQYDRVLSAVSGSFAFTGMSAGVYKKPGLFGAAGSFAITGTASNLEYGHVLSVGSGTFNIAGIDAILVKGLSFLAIPGAFEFIGFSADLTHAFVGVRSPSGSRYVQFMLERPAWVFTQIQLVYTIDPEVGEFDLTGTDAGLEIGYLVSAVSGNFSITGIDASLTEHYIPLETGAFEFTGIETTLVHDVVGPRNLRRGIHSQLVLSRHPSWMFVGIGYSINAGNGVFSFTGTAATLMHLGGEEAEPQVAIPFIYMAPDVEALMLEVEDEEWVTLLR